VNLPQVDVLCIGAGGGSLGRVDAFGALHVGPESAGAVPGPAAYGRGGDLPTVTDAHLVLGTLTAQRTGPTSLDPFRRCLRAGARRRADGLSVEEAAAIIRSPTRTWRRLRVISVARGIDPRAMTLVALGGAGHARLLVGRGSTWRRSWSRSTRVSRQRWGSSDRRATTSAAAGRGTERSRAGCRSRWTSAACAEPLEQSGHGDGGSPVRRRPALQRQAASRPLAVAADGQVQLTPSEAEGAFVRSPRHTTTLTTLREEPHCA
jgi:hypothetical protein